MLQPLNIDKHILIITQPQRVNNKTIIIEPQPLSITANGGNRIESKTLQKLIVIILINELLIRRIYITNVTFF